MKSVFKLVCTIIGATLSVAAIEATPVVAATFDVTNINNSGAGSLGDAISQANVILEANVIDFLLGSQPQTINLATDLPRITGNLTIDGPGANLLTVSGNVFSIFFVNNGATAGISGLTVANGSNGITNLYGTATVSNSTFTGNNTGIINYGTATVSNSTFTGNNTGIINNGTATVSNSTFTGNNTGIINQFALGLNSFTIATVSSSTLSNNNTGIYNNSSTSNIGNTIIAQNSIDVKNLSEVNLKYTPFFVPGIINDQGHNLIGNGDNSPFAGKNGVDGNIVGTTANPVGPKLSPLADNGGLTPTQALLPGSPAIDAGSNALILSGITTDQRGYGFERISNGTVDIGAFEVQARSVPEPASTLEILAFGSLFGTSFLLKRQLMK